VGEKEAENSPFAVPGEKCERGENPDLRGQGSLANVKCVCAAKGRVTGRTSLNVRTSSRVCYFVVCLQMMSEMLMERMFVSVTIAPRR